MELHLDPIIPVTRVVNGHNVFNKGYRHGMKGKTFEEYYGEERAKEIKRKMSESLKGHPCWTKNKAASKPCVAISEGRIVARFDSCKDAAKALGINYTNIRRYLKGIIKSPRNGWQWFYESESYKWCDLIRQ